MEAFLRAFLPKLLPKDVTFQVHPFQGKRDLLKNLDSRLRAYAAWLPKDWRIVVLVDCDDQNCRQLKNQMEQIAHQAGLQTRTHAGRCRWQLVNRIVVRELEAWYFGDWQAVRTAYPKVPRQVPQKKRFRKPDDIRGAWEAFQKLMQSVGYFRGGLAKIDAARTIGRCMNVSGNRSRSFKAFCDAVREAGSQQQCDPALR